VIRPAKFDDIEALVLMGQRFFSDASYRGPRRAIEPRTFATHLCRLLSDENVGFFVSERGGVPVAAIAVLLTSCPFDGRISASKMHWIIDPELGRGEGIRLARHAEKWARAGGAVELFISGMNDEVDALLPRLGFEHVEKNFSKVLA
jgi:hypothetical protein